MCKLYLGKIEMFLKLKIIIDQTDFCITAMLIIGDMSNSEMVIISSGYFFS